MITSKTNDLVKYALSLNDKKYRKKYNKYIVEGVKMVKEVIYSEGTATEYIFYAPEILENTTIGRDCLNLVKGKEKSIEVSESVFKHISGTETPQGILAIVEKNSKTLADLKQALNGSSTKTDRFVILENVQDLGNIGTIIRSAVAFNINNVICVGTVGDPYSPKVVRSTMGCILRSNIYMIEEQDIEEMISVLKEYGYSIVGTSLNAKKYFKELDVNNKTIYVFGNESQGMSEKMSKLCSENIKIPMENTAESLNVSVAAAILMYDMYARGKTHGHN